MRHLTSREAQEAPMIVRQEVELLTEYYCWCEISPELRPKKQQHTSLQTFTQRCSLYTHLSWLYIILSTGEVLHVGLLAASWTLTNSGAHWKLLVLQYECSWLDTKYETEPFSHFNQSDFTKRDSALLRTPVHSCALWALLLQSPSKDSQVTLILLYIPQ